MYIEPYVFFEGRCEEAIEFYRRAAGAEVVMIMRYSESPEPPTHVPPGSEQKIMHSMIKIGDSNVMMSDGRCSGQPTFQGISLAITVANKAEAERVFKGMGEGGQVVQPPIETFFSPSFGMLTDKFGIMWMVVADQEAAQAQRMG